MTRFDNPPTPDNDEVETFISDNNIDILEKKFEAKKSDLKEQENTFDKSKLVINKRGVLKETQEITGLKDKIYSLYNEEPEKDSFPSNPEAKMLGEEEKKEIEKYNKPMIGNALRKPPFLKKMLGMLGFLSIAGSAMAGTGEGEKVESGKAKTETVRTVDKGTLKTLIEKQGYKQEGNTTVYRKESKSEIGQAKPSKEQGGAKYENWLKGQLAQGISPKELVSKGYISPEEAGNYEKYYVATVDRVTTSEETVSKQQEDPFAHFAGRKEVLNNCIKHNIGEIWYPDVSTTSKWIGGALNTQEPPVIIRLRDKQTEKWTDQYVVLSDEAFNAFGVSNGTNTLQMGAAEDMIREKATDKETAFQQFKNLAGVADYSQGMVKN